MIKKILLVSSVVLFLLATFGVSFGSVAIIPLALGVFAASFLDI